MSKVKVEHSHTPQVELQVSNPIRKRFAEEKTFEPEWLTYGLEFVLDRLRTKCYKHQLNRSIAAYDKENGANLDAIGKQSPPAGWFSCGCSHTSHILDLLAFKVSARIDGY
jgi:hypothetical protein